MTKFLVVPIVEGNPFIVQNFQSSSISPLDLEVFLQTFTGVKVDQDMGKCHIPQHILYKMNNKTFFKPHQTLNQLFRSTKDKNDPLSGPGVYEIPCSCGKSYIGQTGRSFKTQLEEHMEDTGHNWIAKSAISEHYHSTGHLICFDKSKIISLVPFHSSRIIREALEIEKHPNNFNHDDGYHLNQSWKTTIHFMSPRHPITNSNLS